MATSKVGLGWPVGERQYTTLAAWVTALKTSGAYEEAWCSGSLGSSFVTIGASDFPQGALIRGDVQYTGANHAAIASIPRSITVNSTAAIWIRDLNITNPNTTQHALNILGANVVAERCYVWQTTNPGSNAATLMAGNGAIAKNCVIINTLTSASKVARPSSGGVLQNCVVVGGDNGIQSEWTNSKTEKCFAVNASTACYVWNNGRPTSNVTNASSDLTGDVGFKNLPALTNFVDYANADYRIRASSPLHAAGIGAFFEDVTYIGESTLSLEASLNAAVDSSKIGASVVAFQGGASTTVGYSKISSATASLPSGATMSLAAAKVTSGILNLIAGSAAAISSHKVGVATIYMVADASAELYAGNVYIGEGTFTVSAAADISLQGGKVGASPVQFNAAAAAYCAASKQGGDTLSAGAAASGQLQSHKMGQSTTQAVASSSINLDGFKMGAGTPVFLASVSISISGTPAANQTPVALIFVRTSSRYRHNMRTSSRYRYNVRTSSGGARV